MNKRATFISLVASALLYFALFLMAKLLQDWIEDLVPEAACSSTVEGLSDDSFSSFANCCVEEEKEVPTFS